MFLKEINKEMGDWYIKYTGTIRKSNNAKCWDNKLNPSSGE